MDLKTYLKRKGVNISKMKQQPFLSENEEYVSSYLGTKQRSTPNYKLIVIKNELITYLPYYSV